MEFGGWADIASNFLLCETSRFGGGGGGAVLIAANQAMKILVKLLKSGFIA